MVIIWNFTDDGFTSVVEYAPPATKWDKDVNKHMPFVDEVVRQLPDDYRPADKENLSSHLLVRARIKEDLSALKEYDADAVETEDKLADYQFRLVIRRSAYAQYLYDKAMLLDYNSHVKETIDKRAPYVAGGRYGALSQIWSACARWQPNDPWGNAVSYGGYGQAHSHSSSSFYAGKGKSNGGSQGTKSYANEVYHPQDVWTNGATGTGGAAPKAITDGSVIGKPKSGPEDVDRLDEALAFLDRDTPPHEDPSPHLDLGETIDGLHVTADATRASMIAQVRDVVNAMGRTCEVEALVDELQETFGTCDVDKVPHDVLVDMTKEYESVSTILASM